MLNGHDKAYLFNLLIALADGGELFFLNDLIYHKYQRKVPEII